MPEQQYTELQIDALREVANTGSGHAAGDLSEMLGHSFEISVPRAVVTDIGDAIEQLGGAENEVSAVGIRVGGDVEAMLVAMFTPEQASNLCMLLGIESDSDMGRSVLQEVGNVLACAYANVLAEMSGISWDVHPPDVMTDMLGSIVSSLIAATTRDITGVLLIDSKLSVNDADAEMSVLFVPFDDGIDQLLQRLGVG
ncbi:MAG: CheC, inhibitor of methylation [Thermoleophilia bacterium]|nr:CheC, inhibitor of methylation [Thermoleophilia bacterium]